MEKLTDKEVMHVANLARLNINEDEVEKYKNQLSAILTEIDKITNVDLREEGDILIAPIDHSDVYKEDVEGKMLTKEEIFMNAKNISGDYIVVPKVLND
jgi:aspartyl-tRNA(Asn)/glutamyl-tRNA(Gln) amidotransferase subunit C